MEEAAKARMKCVWAKFSYLDSSLCIVSYRGRDLKSLCPDSRVF